ncbi:MAG TPA: hypothetical protein DCZ95_10240, partial [Verrucomicrobia bacterium]|nr:hypothetical protein [Verrucomicrobiota bacterium]
GIQIGTPTNGAWAFQTTQAVGMAVGLNHIEGVANVNGRSLYVDPPFTEYQMLSFNYKLDYKTYSESGNSRIWQAARNSVDWMGPSATYSQRSEGQGKICLIMTNYNFSNCSDAPIDSLVNITLSSQLTWAHFGFTDYATANSLTTKQYRDTEVRFVKHAESDEEQWVLLKFDPLLMGNEILNSASAAQVFFRGSPGISIGYFGTVGFVTKIKPNVEQRVTEADFQWPSHPNLQWKGHLLSIARVSNSVISSTIVPDWNHDRKIDSLDQNQATAFNPFRFWINDDHDLGDVAEGDSDIPGQENANHEDDEVNGRCDLPDFFPVWLDLNQILNLFPPSATVQYKLKQADAAVKIVYTDLTKDQAGNFLTTEGNTYGPSFNQNAFEADAIAIASFGIVLNNSFLLKIKNNANKGVLMMEGTKPTTAPLILELWVGGIKIFEQQMPLSIDGVEKMYRSINIRPSGGPPTSTGEPANNPDYLNTRKNVFFLHGFNVTAEGSRGWNAEMFKKLYQSGSRARFWGMTWDGDVGLINALHYQENVASALIVASNFCMQLQGITGEKIVLAHSLGNMVVSSAIQDYGLSVTEYFMLDSAVATECYAPSLFNDATVGNYMLHEDYIGYNSNTWCSTWFRLFSSPDDREKLTWQDRFPSILSVAYNFYSTGDEVFEVYPGTPSVFSGGPFHLEQYAWQKQEIFKGRGGLGGTDWAGWGFEGYWTSEGWISEYTMEQANAAIPAQLRTNAVFLHEPTTMFSSNITAQVANDIIAQGVPALSYAAGIDAIAPLGLDRNYNANDHKPNGWGRSGGDYGARWLHSDLKNMAYFYTYDLFNQLVSQGGLQ